MLTLKTPVTLFIFNRPRETQEVLKVLAEQKPSKLFIIADGPRTNKSGEEELVQATRKIIDTGINWKCEVTKKYSKQNLGCAHNVSSGITWALNQVPESIILEDDCIPSPQFFPYCEELLEKYRDNKKVFSISGNNYQFGYKNTQDSYYFSVYSHCWGWATWKRAWDYYDHKMIQWPQVKKSGALKNVFNDAKAARIWTQLLDQVYRGQTDSWSIRWNFACWMQKALTVLPNENLVTNIGFGTQDATNTDKKNILSQMPLGKVDFPLTGPSIIAPNQELDQRTLKFYKPRLVERLKYVLNEMIN